MRKEKFLKRVSAFLLAITLVLTGMPFGSLSLDTAEAASKKYPGISGSLESTRLRDYDKASSKYMQIYWVDYSKEELRDDGSCYEAASLMQIYQIDTGGSVDPLVFCIEHGVSQKETSNMKARYAEDSEVWHGYENEGMDYAMENIFNVLMFAPIERSNSKTTAQLSELGFEKSKYYGQNGNDYTLAAWVAATQCLIWECQQNMRDKDFNRQANGLSYQTSLHGTATSKIPADHYITNKHIKGTPAMDIYNFMASEIKKREEFDSSIGSEEKEKPVEIKIPDDAEFPYLTELNASKKSGGELQVLDEKGKEAKNIRIKYDKAANKYTLTVEDESALNTTFTVCKKDAATKRAARYLDSSDSKYYQPYIWAYATNKGESHTQGFVSGLKDPTMGYIKVTKNPNTKTELKTCEPPEVDVFPTITMPIEKVDANAGFDGNKHTPMGDATLDAQVTLERKIGQGSWNVIDKKQFDDFGSEIVFSDQPFKSAEELSAYLTESGSLSECDHPIYDEEGNIVGYEHVGSKSPTEREWSVTVNYRITITRPEGRYIDPDKYGGVREYKFEYNAYTEDTCEYWCQDDPWTDVEYTFTYGATKGDGGIYTESGTSFDRTSIFNCELETDVEDVFRGRFLLIKSNEKENPFKDSALGGSDSNMSKQTKWTIRLASKGYEGEEYVHLVSTNPKTGDMGTNIYTVAREKGIVNNEANPMVVGSNGELLVEDLPYGEYIVSEVATDDPMYVAEQFRIVISEHNGNGEETKVTYQDTGDVPLNGLWSGYNKSGTNKTGAKAEGTGDYYNNLYQVNLRDKVKSNRIKIEKIDSETGKVVRLSGTKVFIRYKGNPDYTDSENKERYGANGTIAKNIYNRFLPNAESINSKSTNYTFELDENGCIDIEYELPYGIYEIYEWLLPDGYYVGEYDEKGIAKNHNFGFIEEGQFTVEADKHGFNATVPAYAVTDKDGNKVKYQEEEKYSFEDLTAMVTNRYTFTVTKQNMHIDGNYSELVTYNGELRTDADPTYDKGDYPYEKYYKTTAVANNSVKGKIEISKKGEVLTGWREEIKDGKTVFTPVYEMAKKLSNAVFGIYAAEDIKLNDGTEGPKIYDSKTNEEIKLELSKSTHFSNTAEKVKAFTEKLQNPKEYTAAKYDTGEYSHESGAELWYMLEREVSEGNIKRTIYVTPEQKDTTYEYSFTTSDETFTYTYTVEVVMKNKAGGDNITSIKMRKDSVVTEGYMPYVTLTHMTGSVGDNTLDPIGNYIKLSDGIDPNLVSSLDAIGNTYIYEADGEVGYDYEQNTVDYSDIGVRRYAVKEYVYYLLTEEELKTEERKVGEKVVTDKEGVDANGDGDYEDEGDTPPETHTEDVMETKTVFEWENEGWELVGEPEAGDKAILRQIPEETNENRAEGNSESSGMQEAEDVYKAAVIGYYRAENKANLKKEEAANTVNYTKLITGSEKYSFIESDEKGEQILEYKIPDGYSEVEFTGDPTKEARYIIASRTIKENEAAEGESEKPVYKVLLDDLNTWQDSSETGNFIKKAVQTYEVKYTQVFGDENGFGISWDGFDLESSVDIETNTATTIITKQKDNIMPIVDLGAGYEYETSENVMTFTSIPISSPIYFKWNDGVKADAYYKGGVCYATIALPQSAVDYLYEEVVPTLCFRSVDENGDEVEIKFDWYSKLTPENPKETFGIMQGLPEGCKVIASRTDSLKAGEESSYYIEIITNLTEEKPLSLTFADGYTIDVYATQAESGNGVGVVDLHNVYKTIRYTKGKLVETVKTNEEGYAVSSLLPLGKYIVRELNAPNGYVTSDKEYEVELTYENQFVPLVWESISCDNEYMSVEIDLSKVFETAYESGVYAENGGATFGLYAGEKFTASNAKDGYAKAIEKDSLIDVIYVDANGKAKSTRKLPYGTYYIKEMSTLSTHKKDEKPYYFKVDESEGDISEPCSFDYAPDGISGDVVLDKYGEGTISVKVQNRYPMPSIKIGERVVSLTESIIEDGLKVTVEKDYTTVTITAKDNTPLLVTLPNGKVLTVTVKGNIYEYTLDGVSDTYTPEVSYTGYYAAYTHEFTANTKVDFSVETESISFKTAGNEQSTISVEVIHTPVTKTEKVWNDANNNGVKDEGEETDVISGVLDKDGKQSYTHQAVFTVDTAKESGTSGTDDPESTQEPDGRTVKQGESVTFTDENGTTISLSLDGNGKFKIEAMAALSGKIEEANYPKATLNGADDSKNVEFVRSVTLARQDQKAKTLQIKVNTLDDLNVSPIKNEHLKVDTPSYTPSGGGTKYRFELTKNDIETGETLSGAVFEIYGSHEDENGNIIRDEKPLYKDLVTDKEGSVKLTLPAAGTYYYHETKAPSGYICDGEYYEFSVGKDGKVVATVTMTNEKEEYEEAESKDEEKTEKLIKKTDKAKKQEREKKIKKEESEVPKTGDECGGHFIFYFMLLIAAGGVIFLFTRRKYWN